MKTGFSAVQRYLKDDRAVTAVEYGMIAGLIGVTIIGALAILSGELTNVFNDISNAMQ